MTGAQLNYSVGLGHPIHSICHCLAEGFPGGSEVKVSACNAGDLGSIPGLGRSPGEGNGNPLQYSCLENPMHGGAWWATLVHGVAKSRTLLSDFTHSLTQFHDLDTSSGGWGAEIPLIFCLVFVHFLVSQTWLLSELSVVPIDCLAGILLRLDLKFGF